MAQYLRRSPKEIREVNEAALWLRNSVEILKRLQRRLSHTGHKNDAYRRAKIQEYWDKVRYFKLMMEGKL